MSNVLDDATEAFKRGLRKVLLGIALTGWTCGWIVIGLIGWATNSAAVLDASFAALGATVAGGLIFGYSARKRRRALAQTSLAARLELEGVRVFGDMRAVVELFDLTSRDVLRMLAGRPLDDRLARSVEDTLERARAELDGIAAAWAQNGADLDRMKRLGDIEHVRSAIAASERKRADLERSAQRVLEGAQDVSKKLAEVAGLIGPGDANRAPRALEEAVSALDETARAYRELSQSTALTKTD